VVLVKLELGRRRTILLHGFDDLGDAGRAPFGEFQFLEKLADAPIAIAPGPGMAGAQLIQPHRTVRAGIADDKSAHRLDTDLDGLASVVAPVIDRIDDGFLDRVVGEVLDPRRLGAIMDA
jgi:hypothetical protein